MHSSCLLSSFVNGCVEFCRLLSNESDARERLSTVFCSVNCLCECSPATWSVVRLSFDRDVRDVSHECGWIACFMHGTYSVGECYVIDLFRLFLFNNIIFGVLFCIFIIFCIYFRASLSLRSYDSTRINDYKRNC